MLKKSLLAVSLAAATAMAVPVHAADYLIDTKGAHAFVQFRVKHLGYSWLLGRFNDFGGKFNYDEANPAASKVSVEIKTASVDSNHAERDKHLRGKDFLDVEKFPSATFVSTAYEPAGDRKAKLKGDLTLHGVTRPVVIDVEEIGAGPDPWGGQRRGFAGSTVLVMKDFDISRDLGPASREVEMFLSVEGIMQK